MIVKLDHFPKDRGENIKKMKPPPSWFIFDYVLNEKASWKCRKRCEKTLWKTNMAGQCASLLFSSQKFPTVVRQKWALKCWKSFSVLPFTHLHPNTFGIWSFCQGRLIAFHFSKPELFAPLALLFNSLQNLLPSNSRILMCSFGTGWTEGGLGLVPEMKWF